MKIKQDVFLVLVIAIMVLVATAIVQPSRDFGPPAESAPTEIRETAQTIEAALERSGRLPPPGTQLVRRNGILEWETIPQTSPEIVAVQVSEIRLTSGASLLMSLLDDDPTYRAEADVIVATSDQSKTLLRVAYWVQGRWPKARSSIMGLGETGHQLKGIPFFRQKPLGFAMSFGFSVNHSP